MRLKAPFPWFGGKSRAAHLVWERFGNVRNYVEPFAGSLAVLLGRPWEPQIETVNDLDCWISNFWRAMQADPEELAYWADWPVNEADLHARHLWLVKQADFRERIKTDPDYFDVKIAGWWVWGISQWIGGGWCATPGSTINRQLDRADGTPRRGRPNLQQAQGVQALITPGRTNAGRTPRAIFREVVQKRPFLTNHGGGMGVHSKRPRLGGGGRGVSRQIPGGGDYPELIMPGRAAAGKGDPRGVHGRGVWRQIPDLGGNCGATGRGIHASAATTGIETWFYALAERLRRVRVCCGDWTRVLGPAPTTCIGTTGVFLDPPYAINERSDVYNEESRDVANAVREWAIANGDNPELRIALCGYEGEHDMPESWTVVAWKANGGFANQKRQGTRGQVNAHRERIWFSPYCLQATLFDGVSDGN